MDTGEFDTKSAKPQKQQQFGSTSCSSDKDTENSERKNVL